MEKNKIGKYLKYAIGEIVLVVIGILIALQINAVNQNRQRAKLENVLLQQVKSEMIDIYNDLWNDLEILRLGDKSHSNINNYITQDAQYVDSFCFDFYWINYDEYIYPKDAAYSRLKEEGLDIIKNDTIRLYLQGLYESHFPRLTKNNSFTPDISEVFNDYYLDAFKPNTDFSIKFSAHMENDTIGNRNFSDQQINYPRVDNRTKDQYTIGYVPLNFDALKKDTKFLMLLEQTKRHRDYKRSRYSNAKSIIKQVIEIINRELE